MQTALKRVCVSEGVLFQVPVVEHKIGARMTSSSKEISQCEVLSDAKTLHTNVPNKILQLWKVTTATIIFHRSGWGVKEISFSTSKVSLNTA